MLHSVDGSKAGIVSVRQTCPHARVTAAALFPRFGAVHEEGERSTAASSFAAKEERRVPLSFPHSAILIYKYSHLRGGGKDDGGDAWS
jgi:hypothetical protein